MGQYGDWAKKQSKFLSVDPGGSVTAEWTGKGVETDDPKYGMGWNFKFLTDDGEKSLTVRNSSLVAQFDNYKAGDMLTVSRTEKDSAGKTKWSIRKEGAEAPF